MFEVMAAERFSTVSFRSTRLSESCAPAAIELYGKCTGSLRGTLTIRNVSKEVELAVEIAEDGTHYLINGTLRISWADFNVEDPSILIARLDPTVTIAMRTTVPLKK
jgi:polyisoprenoid-binding protein YceI